MRLLNLKLKNIGPFIEGDINFISEEDNIQKPPVTIITGENGTGKTIITDAIRGLLGKYNLERNIIRNNNDFSVSLEYAVDNETKVLSSSKLVDNYNFHLNSHALLNRFITNQKPDATWNWVCDYWTSRLSSDSFEAKSLVAPIPENIYVNSLSGIQKNVEVAQLICFFDYLKTSDNDEERELGIRLFDILKKIIKLSLIDGEFKYVARARLEPIVSQMGKEISLEKLSSGNLYLIQRMVSLLGKMYSIHVLNKLPIKDLCKAQGILLIDEAENHLHPKWQKTFIQSIQEIFPNLQIIVTTHSPFIVSSVENAKIFVCNSKGDHAEITDETDIYSNKPIEEILLSPLFGVTYQFNQNITELLQKRKKAINEKDDVQKNNIEKELKKINPQYFNFLDIDNILSEITSK
ncbi:MAG: AAA family ATPase [Desulfobacterales bacterium]|nr:AAA family ATPase [Desulfobacterales bacterium]